ncbi:AbrB family transcriptional regulator [Humitalea sp. 24SJ18S-53]|uniref:AbrB family transcriptional regulator n=1 Tax=Humitalea sp. 24SJ18S-53 TaxID=3422307 RepID=UPI003D66F848
MADPTTAPPAWPRMLYTTAAAVAGGLLFSLLHIPLPWMIGSLIATAALIWRTEAEAPPGARPISLVLLGLGLGQTFTGPVMVAVVGALPALVVAGVVTIASGLLVARLFMWLADTDARTGFFCAVPGGIVVMAVLGQRAGAHGPSVTLSQTLRMVLVVLVFPPLISLIAPHAADGAFSAPRPDVTAWGLPVLLAAGTAVAVLANRLGFVNPWMLGPCFMTIGLSALGLMPSGLPLWLVDAAQIGMGMTLGLKLTKRFLLGSRRLLIASILSTLALSVLLAVLAVPLGWGFGLPPTAVVLGMAPGGMPEMAITAKALDLAVPLVLGFHLTRVVLCNLLIQPIWKLGLRLGLV